MGIINTGFTKKQTTCEPKANAVVRYDADGNLLTKTCTDSDDSTKAASTAFVHSVIKKAVSDAVNIVRARTTITESTESISIPEDISGLTGFDKSYLCVYQNGLLLEEILNYTIIDDILSFVDYMASPGDIISFIYISTPVYSTE